MSEKWTQIETALEINQNGEPLVKVLNEFRTYPSAVHIPAIVYNHASTRNTLHVRIFLSKC